jgi:type III restriction enzyme
MIETKAANNVNDVDVQAKKQAAEKYCKHASDYTVQHVGKAWQYLLLPHTDIARTVSLNYLIVRVQ